MAGGFAVAVTRWAALFGVHHKRHSEGAEGRGGGVSFNAKTQKTSATGTAHSRRHGNARELLRTSLNGVRSMDTLNKLQVSPSRRPRPPMD